MTDARSTIAALAALAAEVHREAVAVTRHHTALLQTAVKRHAAQPRTNPRPRGATVEGPRLLTGSYNRSINRRVDVTPQTVTGTVGTADVRGPALEHGNPNAFGRGITTLPYPHMGPGLDETGPAYVAAAQAIPTVAAIRTSGLRRPGGGAR